MLSALPPARAHLGARPRRHLIAPRPLARSTKDGAAPPPDGGAPAAAPQRRPSLEVSTTEGDFSMALTGPDPQFALRLAQGLGLQLAGGLAAAQPHGPQSPAVAAEGPQEAEDASGANATACGGGTGWPALAPGTMQEYVRWGGALMPLMIRQGLSSPLFLTPADSKPRKGDLLSKHTPSDAVSLPKRGDELLARIKAGGVPGVKFMAEERGGGGGAAGAGARLPAAYDPLVWCGRARKHVIDPRRGELLSVFAVEGSAMQCTPTHIWFQHGVTPLVRPCYLENMGPHRVVYLDVYQYT